MGDGRYLPKNVVTKFIQVYREHPALWKVKSKEYTNKHLKNMAYDKLIKVCKDVEPNANRDWVSKKIQSLRGAFRKELKKIEQSQRNGASPDDVYVPSLWYFDLLLFTLDQELDSPVNVTSKNTKEEDIDFTYSDDSNSDKEPEPSTRCKENYTEAIKSRKRKNTDKEGLQNLFETYSSSDLAGENHEFEAVGINVAAKLKRMDPMQQLFAESLIQNILTRGLLKKLSENTTLYENDPLAVTTQPHQQYQIQL